MRKTNANVVDDVLQGSKTVEEHLEHLRALFEAIARDGWQIRFEKCVLAAKEVKFAGFAVSKNAVKPLESLTESVVKAKVPETKTELRSFLGMANQFRSFIKDFSQKCSALYELTKKSSSAEVQLNQLALNQFNNLKKEITETPVLKIYDPNDGPLKIQSDASNVSVGAVLLQCDRPIAFTSKNLTAPEKNYSVYERELLAVIKALKQFKYYVMSSPHQTEVETDHRALTNLLKSETNDPYGRRARWIEQLSMFSPKIRFVEGKSNSTADYLSRLENPPILEWVKATEKDLPIQNMLAEGTAFLEEGTARLVQSGKIVIPSGMLKRMIEDLHLELGHASAEKMIKVLESSYWNESLRRDVRELCGSCLTCQLNAEQRKRQPLQRLPEVSGPNQIIHVDLVGPLPETTSKHKYGYSAQFL